MDDVEPQDLLSESDHQRSRALSAQRQQDRGRSCPHHTLVKIIDKLGLMQSVITEFGVVTGAPVLEAHYECQDCGQTVLQTANPQAAKEYSRWSNADHTEMTTKFLTVLEAVDGVRQALSRRKENP